MGTRREHWRPELLELFEAVRTRLGKPVLVASGWRCPHHNQIVAISEKSQHEIGAALDLRCPAMNFHDFADAAEYAVRTHGDGQPGFGIYQEQHFVHIDLGLNLPPGRRWTV